jgi:hypothetical protein
VKKNGTIEALNMSPKGHYEGLLLRTGKRLIQINFPKHQSDLAATLKAGDEIAAEVEAEEPHGEREHPVFRLIHLENSAGNTFSGRIVRLNYALHGEVNGGILDSGDFLHLKPEGARALGIELGMKVEGSGARKPTADGHFVIEAEEVNGIAIEHGKARKKHAASKHAAKHARP